MQSKLHQPFFLYRIDQFIADDFLCGVAAERLLIVEYKLFFILSLQRLRKYPLHR